MPAARRLGLYLAPTLDGVPASPNPDELTDIVAFIAAQQVHPDRRVSYLGTDAAGIIAELDALKPPWLTTARVLRDGRRITGAVITEWDDDLGRAWIVGPWVLGVGDAWMAAAVALLDAALAELPPTVTRYEMSGASLTTGSPTWLPRRVGRRVSRTTCCSQTPASLPPGQAGTFSRQRCAPPPATTSGPSRRCRRR